MDRTDPWAWAIEAWWEHFGTPFKGRAGATYRLDRVDRPEYWQTSSETLWKTFPPEIFFDRHATRPADVTMAQARIGAARGENDLFHGGVLHDGDTVAAMFSGKVVDAGTYRMWNTIVHPEHRGLGLYGQILTRTLAYTKAVGFDVVVSEHAPSNNPVLIAKLKAGFRLTKLEIDPFAGPSVHLAYFHNAEHLAAYEFRCGLAKLTDAVVESASSAMDLLVGQIEHAAPKRRARGGVTR